jgi:hypothetical protein
VTHEPPREILLDPYREEVAEEYKGLAPDPEEAWSKYRRTILDGALESLDAAIRCLRDVLKRMPAASEHAAKHENFSHLKSDGSQPTTAKEPTYTVRHVRDSMIGCSGTTLRTYAKKAGVQRPGRGGKSYRYPRADVIRILKAIISEGADQTIVGKCREALESFGESLPTITS